MENSTESHMPRTPSDNASNDSSTSKGFITFLVFIFVVCLSIAVNRFCTKIMEIKAKFSDGKLTNMTPVSLLEVKVTLPSQLIFGDEDIIKKCEPSELFQIPKVRLGEGTLGSLFKVVLVCGYTVTIRKIRDGLVKPDEFEVWTKFLGGIRDKWLLPIQCSFWYGGEAFLLYEYLCLGSLEELLHGCEGIQFTPLSWEIRKRIAQCAAMAVTSIHGRVTQKGTSLICGVIKSSNILIREDFSACLSGYEIPYLVPLPTIIRRNPGRVAPELITNDPTYPKSFTPSSDVYSFGILLLEIVTGKRPSVTNLAEMVHENRGKDEIRRISDTKLGEAKDGMIEMVGIACQCLSFSPKGRPSMVKVVHMLRGL